MQWQELYLSLNWGIEVYRWRGHAPLKKNQEIDYRFSLLITPSKLMPSSFAQYPLWLLKPLALPIHEHCWKSFYFSPSIGSIKGFYMKNRDVQIQFHICTKVHLCLNPPISEIGITPCPSFSASMAIKRNLTESPISTTEVIFCLKCTQLTVVWSI